MGATIDAFKRKVQELWNTPITMTPEQLNSPVANFLASIPTKEVKQTKRSYSVPDVNAIAQALVNRFQQTEPVKRISEADRAVEEALGPLAIPGKISKKIGQTVIPAAASLATYLPEVAWNAGGAWSNRWTDPDMPIPEKIGRSITETGIPMAATMATGALSKGFMPIAKPGASALTQALYSGLQAMPTGAMLGGSYEASKASRENLPWEQVAMHGLTGAGQGAISAAILSALLTGVGAGTKAKPKIEDVRKEYPLLKLNEGDVNYYKTLRQMGASKEEAIRTVTGEDIGPGIGLEKYYNRAGAVPTPMNEYERKLNAMGNIRNMSASERAKAPYLTQRDAGVPQWTPDEQLSVTEQKDLFRKAGQEGSFTPFEDIFKTVKENAPASEADMLNNAVARKIVKTGKLPKGGEPGWSGNLTLTGKWADAADRANELMMTENIGRKAAENQAIKEIFGSKKKIGGSQSGFFQPFGDIGPSNQAIVEGATEPSVTGPSRMARNLMRTPTSEPVFSITGGPELGDKGFLPTLNEPFGREKTTTGNFDKLVTEQFKKEAGKKALDKKEFFKDLADSLNVIQTYSDIANEKIPSGPARTKAIDDAVGKFKNMVLKNHDYTARDQFIYLPDQTKAGMKGKEVNVITYLDEILNTKDPVDKVIKFDALANAQHQRGNIITMDLDIHGTGPLRTRINGAVKNWLDKLRDYQPNPAGAASRAIESRLAQEYPVKGGTQMPLSAGFMKLPEDTQRAILDTLGLAALPVVGGAVYKGAKEMGNRINEAYARRFAQ